MLVDIRYALHTLARSPLFAFTAIAALALGIGANTAIYSVVNTLLRNPLGIDDPEKVVAVRVRYGGHNMPDIGTSAPDFADIRDSSDVFAAAGMLTTADYAFTGGDLPERLVGAQVSWRWFDVFGVRPAHGRGFLPEEDAPDNNRVVVLSHGLFERLFGGDESIVGRSIPLNDQPHKVVGIMGPEFRWPNEADLWIPIALPAERFTAANRHNQSYFTVARLADGVEFPRAAAFVKLLTGRIIDREDREYSRISGWGLFIKPFIEHTAGDLRPALLTLAAAVGFVLLIACANIAGLMLARVSARSKEIAVRAALGASRWNLIRHTVMEGLVLAGFGAAAGLALAASGVRLLASRAPQDVRYRLDIPLDASVLGLTLSTRSPSAPLPPCSPW